jgi:hypothetical protein
VRQSAAKPLASLVDEAPESAPRPVPPLAPALALVALSRVEEGRVIVEIGGAEVVAKLDASVHPAVIEGAARRKERVLAEIGPEGVPVVVGALRTRPTPGIDAAEEYRIEAGRVAIEAAEEVSLSARTASVVVKAIGEVETYAERILSRAEGVHKIIGRMLRLN